MRHLYFCLVGLLSSLMIGCGSNPSNGPFGPPDQSEILAPYVGQWTRDIEKTFAAQKIAGATDEEIQQRREMYANHPSLGEIQSNLTFNGNVAVSEGLLNSEYRFFGMHKHGDKACGKAWHHEDRFDPGDMSKCYVIMEIIDGQLHMTVHMVDGLPDENDPDLIAEPAVETDAADCEIDANVGRNPGDWEISVYRRSS